CRPWLLPTPSRPGRLMSADPRIEELLSRWQTSRDEGRPLTADELCRDCPELHDAVTERIDALERQARAVELPPTVVRSPLVASGPLDAPPLPGRSDLPTRPFPPAEDAELPIGIPGYSVLGELGRGGMGVVYQARHLALDRVVALKMILPDAWFGNQERQRFRNEAEAVAAPQHPNIVQIFEIGEHRGRPFFILEFCTGGSLEKRLKGGPLAAREAAEVVRVLARAMQAAHAAGVVHRDLKPANVLLALSGGSQERSERICDP